MDGTAKQWGSKMHLTQCLKITKPLLQKNMSALWMLVAALFFSIMGAGIKLASAEYSVAEIIFYRNLIGLVIMSFIMWINRCSPRTPNWKMHLNRGIIGVTSMMLSFAAISMLPLATATTLNYTSSIWIAIMLAVAPLFHRHQVKPDTRLLIGIMVSFVGVVCLLQPTIRHNQLGGGFIGLLAGATAALAYMTVRELGYRGEPEMRTVFYFSAIGVVIAGVWMGLLGFHAHTKISILLLGVVGLSATLAQLALTRAYQFGNTLVSANFQYAGIIFATIFGIIIWGDHPNTLSWIGMLLIIISSIATTFLRQRST